ncbi:DinB family protein [Corynebacterium hylobatis]|uniref:DinB family protein n=1 Tax=Corynebacterium hylobatis TaxID=1859290 RepID=A0A3S0A044_9CORY|nr:DinB family protein [Corynebacterium hylobatis]RSZ63916.1 DinB family protein [Corynebacterium hylobatis]
MDIKDAYLNLIDRATANLERVPQLSPAQLNTQPGGHPNSAAWNLWHAGRVLDLMGASALAGQPQVWEEQDYRTSFNLGEAGEQTGFGHSPEEAISIVVEDRDMLVDYIRDSLNALRRYVDTLDPSGFDKVIGEFKGEPETVQGRLSLILIDALQHVGMVQYIGGAPELGR